MPKYLTISLVILIFVLITIHTSAQEPFCSVATNEEFHDHFQHLLQESDTYKLQRSSTTVSVPVVFHIELRNGNPVYSENTLLNKLALVNTYFSIGNIAFTNCNPIEYFEDNNTVRISNVINVYLDGGPSGCGVYSGGIIRINVNCNRTFEHILAHELGHALGLPHTHGYTNSGTTNELVDGSNCTTAGDRFCDTPADPNLLGKVNGSCLYTGTATDANGDSFVPDVTNIMSYTRSTCANYFSPEQLAKMYNVALALNYSCCRVDPPIATDVEICAGEQAILTASTTIASGVIHWFEQSSGGNAIHTGENFTTPVLQSSKAYYIEVHDSCVSDRIQVLAKVNPSGGLQLLNVDRLAKLGPEPVGEQPPQGSYPSMFTEIGDSAILFLANSTEIYLLSKGDDTVKLINSDFSASPNSHISGIAVTDHYAILAINNFELGPSLWHLDLTTFATTLLKAFGTDYGYSNYWLTQVGQIVYAQLNHTYPEYVEYAELWKTDGTTGGTQLVKDLRPTNPFANFNFLEFNGELFFTAEDSIHGEELWKSDGTLENTHMIKDIRTGPTGSQIGSITNVDGLIYFSADDSLHGQEMWITDGTLQGTSLFKDLRIGEAGSNPYNFAVIGGNIYFSADDGTNGNEPYICDGTPEGTYMLEDINQGSGSSSPSYFVEFENEIYFSANLGGFNYELLRINDLLQVQIVKDINPINSSVPANLHVHDGHLFFTANDGNYGTELWQTDGTAGGTTITYDIREGSSSSYPGYLFSFDDRLFFTASDSCGNELWVLDQPDYQTCFGGSVTVRSSNSEAMIKWYDSVEGGNQIGSGQEITIYPIEQNITIYGELSINNCSSIRMPVDVTIKESCPCSSENPLSISTSFTNSDHFSISVIGTLHATSQHLNGSNLIFRAQNQIEFFPSFEVLPGGQFMTVIQPCEE